MDVGPQLVALADPTRRTIFELTRAGTLSVRELADEVAVSQPAVSQHLAVLREAGLVSSRKEGTRRLYAADRQGLARLRAWLDDLWDDALDAFVDTANDQDTAKTPKRGERR